jgi:hypothetical protein
MTIGYVSWWCTYLQNVWHQMNMGTIWSLCRPLWCYTMKCSNLGGWDTEGERSLSRCLVVSITSVDQYLALYHWLPSIFEEKIDPYTTFIRLFLLMCLHVTQPRHVLGIRDSDLNIADICWLSTIDARNSHPRNNCKCGHHEILNKKNKDHNST